MSYVEMREPHRYYIKKQKWSVDKENIMAWLNEMLGPRGGRWCHEAGFGWAKIYLLDDEAEMMFRLAWM